MKSLIPWKKKAQPVALDRVESSPFERLHRQVDALFDDFFDHFSLGPSTTPLWPSEWAEDTLTPRFEITESDRELEVRAELPGLEEKDVDVTLDEHVLTVSGVKEDKREERRGNRVLSELHYGRFHRSIPLPEGVDRDQAKAAFKNGVLTVRMPKTGEAPVAGKRIPITGG